MDAFTVIACLVILATFFWAWHYISHTDESDYRERKKWIDQLPSVISTLGVLGTFLGITKGLLFFNPNNLGVSIPLLLDGLKTAFFTSLLGMAGSLILNRVVSHKFSEGNAKTELELSTETIVKAVKDIGKQENLKKLCMDVTQLKDDLEEVKGHLEEQKSSIQTMQQISAQNADELSRLRAVLLTATASIGTIDNNIDSMEDSIAHIQEKVEQYNNVEED